MTELVLPNDTNQLGNLLGGRLMHWMDIAAAVAAQRHSHRVCVTAAVDDLSFYHPILLGEIVILRASVNRAFATSMEIGVQVQSENQMTGDRRTANTAYFTFVALDGEGRPARVPPVIPESPEEKRRFSDAQRRRELRLSHRRKNTS